MARWLQDVAYADVEDADLVEAAAWVVRSMRLVVSGFPRFGESVGLATFCSGLGRMWAERRTTISAPGGSVEAVAVWIHLDRESLRPKPFSEREFEVYGEAASGRRIKARLRHPMPGPDADRAPWVFRGTDTDIADHVNNAAYWEPLEERLLAGPEPTSLDAEIEFRAPAQPGPVDVLTEGERLWIAARLGRASRLARGVSRLTRDPEGSCSPGAWAGPRGERPGLGQDEQPVAHRPLPARVRRAVDDPGADDHRGRSAVVEVHRLASAQRAHDARRFRERGPTLQPRRRPSIATRRTRPSGRTPTSVRGLRPPEALLQPPSGP